MSQNCICDTPAVEIPIMGLKLELPKSAFPSSASSGLGFNTWESNWFNIAKSGAYDFTHNLNLEEPWLCLPRIISRVKTAKGGWEVGELLFCDGDNYLGNTGSSDLGWVISLRANSAHVAFGNNANHQGILKTGGASSAMAKTDVECKLIISY